jgi:hypothetical protein
MQALMLCGLHSALKQKALYRKESNFVLTTFYLATKGAKGQQQFFLFITHKFYHGTE